MKRLRPRLTFANVTSMLALFIALGGSAYAATKLQKNTVGTKQIKANAVTTAKLKKNSVTGAKIKAGAVTGEKVADGSLTGADINGPTTSFSQITQRLRTNVTANFEAEPLYQMGSYTQPTGEVDQIVPSLTVNFAASCEQPRQAEAYFLVEPPAKIGEVGMENLASLGLLTDKGSGAATRTMEFPPYPAPGAPSLIKAAPLVPTQRRFAAALLVSSCSSGSGVTVSGGAVDVIGTK